MEIFSAFLALWGRGSPYSASLAPFLPPFPTGGISSTALSAFFNPTHFLQTKQGAGAPCRAPAPSFFGDALLNVGAPLPRVPTKFREHVSPLLLFSGIPLDRFWDVPPPCSDKISGTRFPSFTVFSGTYPHFTNDKKKRKAPRGKGDPFRTAPEISALFSDHCFLPAQKRMEKAVPLSSSLSTESRQPARRHSFLTMASPSPNPPPAPLCDLSTV